LNIYFNIFGVSREMKESDTNFLEYKSLPNQERQDQAPMQMGAI